MTLGLLGFLRDVPKEAVWSIFGIFASVQFAVENLVSIYSNRGLISSGVTRDS